MKRVLTILLAICCGANLIAQTISLEIEQSRQDSLLVVDIFIENISNEEIVLGSASFPLSDASQSLDLSKAVKDNSFDGPFSKEQNPEAYSSFNLQAKSDYLHLVLLRSFDEGAMGQLVPAQKTQLTRLLIPIEDKCGTAGIFWLTNAGTAISAFDGTDLTAGVNYIGPQAYKITPDLVVPIIRQEGSELYVLEEASNYVWSLDGAYYDEGSRVSADQEGDYLVEAENECERKSSEVYRIESITGIDDATGLTMDLAAFPNPYAGRTMIQYALNASAEVKVEVYDLLGNQLAVLSDGVQAAGVYNYPFSASEKGYKPGVYLVKVTANKVVLTQRIVELGE